MPELHVLHVLSSTERQTYLPISIWNGAVPPLRWAREICALSLLFSVRILQSVLSLMYDLNFGLIAMSDFQFSLSRQKRQQVTTCLKFASLCENPSHMNSGATNYKSVAHI